MQKGKIGLEVVSGSVYCLCAQVLMESLCAKRQNRFGSGERFSLLALVAGADGETLCRKAK